jgi:hypothetical protein
LLKKTINYDNPFTDEPVTEVHYFHMSKADLVQMEMEENKAVYEKDGETITGMRAKLQRIIDSEDGKALMEEVRDLIRRSYGKKEGDRFLKSTEIWEDFAATEAYSQLLFELCTNATAASEFMNGIVPGNLEKIAAEVREQVEAAEASPSTVPAVAALDQAEARLKDAAPASDQVEAETETGSDPTGLTNETTPRTLTLAEANAMDSNELQSGLASGRYKLS